MKSIQYTVRSIPPQLDKTLRDQSKASGKSLNDIVLQTLARGAGVDSHAHFDDLEWFIGAQSLDQDMADIWTWLDSLPQDIDAA